MNSKRQALILKGTNDGAWDWDMETGEYYLSPRWWEMMGRDPANHPPADKVWMQVIHPDDSAVVTANFAAAIKQGRDSYQSEYRMLHQLRHYFPVLGRGHILCNAQNKAVRTSGTSQDLSAKRQTQAHIELLKTCVEKLRDVVLITEAEPSHSPGPVIVYVNPAFEAGTGYSSDEVIGKTPRILQGPQSSRKTLEEISVALRSWQIIRCELINYKKSGELFWVELEITLVATRGDGWFTDWISIQRDITTRKLAEQALQTASQRLNMTLEAAEIGLWTSNLAHGESFQDSRWQKILGYAPCDTTARSDDWLKLVHPDDIPIALSHNESLIHGATQTFEKEFRMCLKMVTGSGFKAGERSLSVIRLASPWCWQARTWMSQPRCRRGCCQNV